MSLGVVGFGCEDALVHLLNWVWPNIFEQSPHVINAVREAVDGLRCSLGAGVIMSYLMQVRSELAIAASAGMRNSRFDVSLFQGLFHPARKVREAYWIIHNNMCIGSQV